MYTKESTFLFILNGEKDCINRLQGLHTIDYKARAKVRHNAGKTIPMRVAPKSRDNHLPHEPRWLRMTTDQTK